MRNRASLQGNANHVFSRLLDSFADGLRDFFCFPHTIPDMPVLVANNHESAETQVLSALDHLGHTIDGNNLVFKFLRIRIDLIQAFLH